MPSRTIRPTQAPAPAPFTYTIGTADGFAPEAVFAEWDGSGAGGDFLPCVSYYSAEGVLLDRAFPDGATLTTGDTAEVGYRPFRRSTSSAAPAGASDYVFVEEQATVSGDWTFTSIPQDARHLVFYLAYRSPGLPPFVQFNGDGGAHYRSLATLAQDFNGAVTSPTVSSGAGASFIELTGMDTEYPARAVVTLPYYALAFPNGFRDRTLECEAVAATDNSVTNTHLHRHAKIAGWWNPHPGAACPAITDVAFILSGGGGNACLYKVL